MRRRTPHEPLDLDGLDPRTRAAFEALIGGDEVEVVRGDERIGTLALRPHVVSGTVVSLGEVRGERPQDSRADVTVVVTTMKLSDAARARLSESFGPGYLVVDYMSAPTTADIVLTNPVSPQLIGLLSGQFPDARVLVTEILDEDHGIDLAGPVGRLIDAGAQAYLPPRPLEQVAQGVHGYLTSEVRGELGPGGRPPLRQIRGEHTS